MTHRSGNRWARHAAAGALLLSGSLAGAVDNSSSAAPEKWAFIDQYCAQCHNATDWAGGVAFDILQPEDLAADAETWENTIRKLRGRLMPPAGNPQPDAQSLHSFVSWMERHLDAAATPADDPNRVTLHRMNRKEYANAVRDLLAVDIDPAETLPPDDARDGFDNIADALQVSPSFMDQYLSAARTVAIKALGNPGARPVGTVYNSRGGQQHFRAAGMPLGTRGGIVVTHDFPADGEYVINIASMAGALWVYNMEFENHLVVTVDRQKIYETTIGGEADMKAIDQLQDPAVDAINARLKNIRFRTTAGPHEIAVTFRHRTYSESEDRLQSHIPGGGQDRVLGVTSFEVRGPLQAVGVTDTPSRQRIFVCQPASAADEIPCAEQIISTLATRAYRRPAVDSDVADLMKFYHAGHRNGGFEAGIQHALTALLADPEFLYRSERVPEGGDISRDLALASRLSFFLWSSVPDEALLRAARSGELRTPEGLRTQVRRLLADPKSASLASNFAFQWLNMAKLGEIQPDVALFPNVDGDIRKDYLEELRLFVDSIFRENRSILDLLGADYTYLNERVALLYGIRDVKGDHFRRVQLRDSTRFGLLGKGAVLMSTSYPNRTAPVLRGAFVLDRIWGTPPAAPPPNVEGLKEDMEGKQATTVRERMAEHSSNPSCNSCHGIMDPLGLALENFDAIGQYREVDRFAAAVIDASGELPDGRKLNGPDDLREALLAEHEQFAHMLTEKLMMYALGRTLTYKDMPRVRAIVRALAADDYRFESLVMNIVTSPEFQRSSATEPARPISAGLTAQPLPHASIR